MMEKCSMACAGTVAPDPEVESMRADDAVLAAGICAGAVIYPRDGFSNLDGEGAVSTPMSCPRVGAIRAGTFPALLIVVAAYVSLPSRPAAAQSQPPPPSLRSLKSMSVDELTNLEVTSVSSRPEVLSRVASAVQVITSEDIRRSGATRLPEALRLAANLEVSQVDSNQWAISARGFNGPLANKLLVLIDGRTVYSPLFAGVFWDAQDVLLEDIDRIEVISGPGATLWGANAVNGVISITTKSATAASGLFVEAGGGSELRRFTNLRYGLALTPALSVRFYGKFTSRDGALLSNGGDAASNWQIGQGGIRLDWAASGADQITLQADSYKNRISSRGPGALTASGTNVLGHWSHTISTNANIRLQLYFDRSHRRAPGGYDDVLDTYDIDFQHRRLSTNERHDIVWGVAFRAFKDDFAPGAIVLVPRQTTKRTISGFVQDGIALIPNRLNLTLGTKIQDEAYAGVGLQPSARLAWTSRDTQTLWTAISRAVRTPSRLDRDLIVPPVSQGGPNFESEQLLSYEVGFRANPRPRLQLSIASFYNDYDNIRSIEPARPPAPFPLVWANGQRGESYGAELTADYRAAGRWRLSGGYAETRLHLRPKPGSADRSFGQTESASSNRRLLLRSTLDLFPWLEIDPTVRYVSGITNPRVPVPGYAELDLHAAWRSTAHLTLSLVGQNLLHDHHLEYGNFATGQRIERSFYGTAAYRW
jgi:iron complex outermembrane receptor protein